MKKIIILFLLSSSTLMAQDFKKELVGKYLPAKVIFGDGKVTDVLMRYQPPQFFRNPKNKFSISMTTSEADAHDQTGGIEAFMIDGIIWALRPSPVAEPSNSLNFVVLKKQGAIEEYDFMTSTLKSESDFKELFNPYGTMTAKVGGAGKMASEMSVAQGKDKQLRAWMSDSPEIMRELQQADSLAEVAKSMAEAKEKNDSAAKNESEVKEEKTEKPKGLLAKLEAAQKKENAVKAAPVTPTTTTTDLTLIVNNYNAWYDEKNPGKIKYYFVDPPVRKLSPLEDFKERQAKQQAYLSREKEKADAKKKIDDLFANRTTTPSSENASAKDNVPVKKETFAAKLERIKADGNKVGVILYLQPVHVNVPTDQVSTSLTSYVAVEGEYLDESLNAAAQEFVAELNKELGTTEIEMIDIQKVPYRDSKYGKLDDWWASKYKVVFAYSLDPRLTSANEEIGGKIKFTASLNMIQSLVVREYIGGPGATKQDIITQVLNMGSFVTPTYAQDDQMTDVKVIYDKTLEKLAVPILSKIREERADEVKKLVEKKLN